MVVLNSTTVAGNSKLYVSRTTLPVHWCSAVFTDVTSLTSSTYHRNIVSKADMLNLTLQLMERDFVKVLVKAVGVKLLKVISTEITEF